MGPGSYLIRGSWLVGATEDDDDEPSCPVCAFFFFLISWSCLPKKYWFLQVFSKSRSIICEKSFL